MGKRRLPFQIRFCYGSGDLREIVRELAQDVIRKSGYVDRTLAPSRHRIADAASRFAPGSSRRKP